VRTAQCRPALASNVWPTIRGRSCAWPQRMRCDICFVLAAGLLGQAIDHDDSRTCERKSCWRWAPTRDRGAMRRSERLATRTNGRSCAGRRTSAGRIVRHELGSLP